MPGKRQHYVPRFLLRRFSIDPANKNAYIWRLNKKTGQPKRVNPANEVVIGRYYRITLEDGTVDDSADQLLDHFESLAAGVISRLADRSYEVVGQDVYELILFIMTQKNRTPQAREALREADERMAELQLEVMLSDRDHYHRVMRKHGETEDQIEEGRLRALDELKAGRVGVESSPEREVALMFVSLEEGAEILFKGLGCKCLRVPGGSKARFVVSDHPVSHYDPTPKAPEAGAGFMSSPNSVTWVPLDPEFGLLLVQDDTGSWEDIDASDKQIDELNLLTYAWSREAIYGPTQEAVARVRRVAKQQRKLLSELRYRPPRIWIAEVSEESGPSGVQEFTSRFKGRATTRAFRVTEQAIAQARREAWSPSDDFEAEATTD